MKDVKLEHIARQLNLSVSTVHRALYNKAGVGKKNKELIIDTAKEMGYVKTSDATQEQRNAANIAVVLPDPTYGRGYFFSQMWQGIEDYQATFANAELTIEYFYHDGTTDGFTRVLKELYTNHASKINGILAIGYNSAESSFYAEKLLSCGISFAFCGTAMQGIKSICHVGGKNELCGIMAAELFTTFCANVPQKLLLISGDLYAQDQYTNAYGFENHIAIHAPQAEVIKLQPCTNSQTLCESVAKILNTKNISGIYCCNAESTVTICKFLEEAGLSNTIKVVGNDLFPESIEYLMKNTLHGILYKQQEYQAYFAMMALVNFLQKDLAPLENALTVSTTLFLKSNYHSEASLYKEFLPTVAQCFLYSAKK